MGGMARRGLAGAAVAAVAFAAGGATIADGQGSGGPPAGTLSFKIQQRQVRSDHGINPAVPRVRTRPKVADLMAFNAVILDPSNRRIGRGHHFDVTTFEGARRYRGRAVAFSFTMVDFGGGNSLAMQCLAEDSPTNNNCAVTGGTGRYAGARGFAVEDFRNAVEDRRRRTFTIPVHVTFMP